MCTISKNIYKLSQIFLINYDIPLRIPKSKKKYNRYEYFFSDLRNARIYSPNWSQPVKASQLLQKYHGNYDGLKRSTREDRKKNIVRCILRDQTSLSNLGRFQITQRDKANVTLRVYHIGSWENRNRWKVYEITDVFFLKIQDV